MGQKDLAEKNLEAYPDVFADCVNALMYQGRAVLKAENLNPAPTETIYYGTMGRSRNQLQDISKYEMLEGGIRVQYNIENETKQHRKTILRKAGYEGAIYRFQYDQKEMYPVVSLVLYWGKAPWKMPRSMHQLMEGRIARETVEYVQDVWLHVYEMANLPLNVRKHFQSDMRFVVDYLAEGSNYIPTDRKIMHLEALLRMMKALTEDERYEKNHGWNTGRRKRRRDHDVRTFR